MSDEQCASCAAGDHDRCSGASCACWTDNALVWINREYVSRDREVKA